MSTGERIISIYGILDILDNANGTESDIEGFESDAEGDETVLENAQVDILPVKNGEANLMNVPEENDGVERAGDTDQIISNLLRSGLDK